MWNSANNYVFVELYISPNNTLKWTLGIVERASELFYHNQFTHFEGNIFGLLERLQSSIVDFDIKAIVSCFELDYQKLYSQTTQWGCYCKAYERLNFFKVFQLIIV